MSVKKRVTLEDIAQKAGVSIPTVSQALAGKGRISQATRERILQVVEELSYQPDLAAQSLARRRTDEVDSRPSRRSSRKSMKQAHFLEYVSNQELLLGLQIEAQQREEEGYKINGFNLEPEALHKMSRPRLNRLYRQLLDSLPQADYPYQEPDCLEPILISMVETLSGPPGWVPGGFPGDYSS